MHLPQPGIFSIKNLQPKSSIVISDTDLLAENLEADFFLEDQLKAEKLNNFKLVFFTCFSFLVLPVFLGIEFLIKADNPKTITTCLFIEIACSALAIILICYNAFIVFILLGVNLVLYPIFIIVSDYKKQKYSVFN